MTKRVVITGMGTINPLGDTLEGYYNALIAGKSGMKKWTSIDLSNVECKIGGDLGSYDVNAALAGYADFLGSERFKAVKKLFRYTTFSARMAILTSLAAWKDAGLQMDEADPWSTGVIVAGHNFNSNYMFEVTKQFQQEPEWIDAMAGVEAIDPNIPGIVSEVLAV
ncbi:MAG: beta-ketoacyl-ACP synthase, partial [Spirochaeta sp. LUC14_002_19_P3]